MSANDTVSVMDQYVESAGIQVAAGDTNAVQSGLAHVGLPAHDNALNQNSTVSLVERPVMGLLLLRATTESAALSSALQEVCGVPLSARLFSESHEACCVRWMSPDCWLLSCPLDQAYAIEQSLRAAVTGHIAIVNVSGGYSVLELSGPDAQRVLMKSTGYDTHPEHLGEGKVVNTTFSKAQVTLRAIELTDKEGRYELIIRRSFSDYVWLWLQRAASEYGLHAVSG